MGIHQPEASGKREGRVFVRAARLGGAAADWGLNRYFFIGKLLP